MIKNTCSNAIRLMKRICIVAVLSSSLTLSAAEPSAYSDSVPTPSFTDVSYGTHSRNVLDFWQAESSVPTPLVFVVHGGGWNGGQKEIVDRFVDVQRLLDAGISVAAINYRLIKHANAENITPPVKAPLYDAARALQFLRSKADEWNIDKEHIAAAGGSAGACTSLWLLYHDDLADPDSSDPIARESTRLYCAAVRRAQTSLDPKQMTEWIPEVTYGEHAFGIASFDEFLLKRDSILPIINEYSPYALASVDDPAVYLYYTVVPGTGKTRGDFVHSGGFGVGLKAHCAELGIPCELYYKGVENPNYTSTTDYLLAKLKGI